jgi:hypothetical protein
MMEKTPMLQDNLPEGLTFDDVLLEPARSEVVPAETDTRTFLTRQIALNTELDETRKRRVAAEALGREAARHAPDVRMARERRLQLRAELHQHEQQGEQNGGDGAVATHHG